MSSCIFTTVVIIHLIYVSILLLAIVRTLLLYSMFNVMPFHVFVLCLHVYFIFLAGRHVRIQFVNGYPG